MSKVILFELNEVPWRVIEDFTLSFPDSSLAKLLKRANKYETHSDDSELSPWVTWPTVHRGVTDHVHGISNFGQNLSEVNHAYPPVWEILAKAGVSTGVFGSLHTHPLPNDLSNCCFHIPDVFAAGSECFPTSVEDYQSWNLNMSRGSVRNVSSKLPLASTAKFLRTLPSLGIRPKTLMGVGQQLINERLHNWKKVRRRTQQVTIAFDVFMKQLDSTKPAFSTFFTNHVASTMHRYWAATYPTDYSEFGYSDQWRSKYTHEIDWTMGKFDLMLERLMLFIDLNPDYDLWLASSMGQAATRADNVATSQTYISDLNTFMSHFSFCANDYKVKPAMAPRHIIELTDHSRTEEFEKATQQITILNVECQNLAKGEVSKVNVKHLGESVFMIRTPVIQNHTKDQVAVDGSNVSFSKLGMNNVTINDQASQTAYHIPEGILLTYSGNNRRETSQDVNAIAITDIAPAILAKFDVRHPGYMNKPTQAIL